MKKLPHKFRVIVVDDERDILDSIQEMLHGQENIEILTAQTAELAIALLPQVDGVIADVVIPNAPELDRIFRNSGKPIIRMSGKINRATNLALPKPFTAQQIKESIVMLKFFSP